MTSLLSLSVLCCSLFLAVVNGRPCPPNSFFVFSPFHNDSHCACARGTRCIGSHCVTGNDSNIPITYTKSQEGFPFVCRDCFCVVERGQPTADDQSIPNFRWITTTDGDRIRDFEDPLFDQTCHVVPDTVIPKPRALPFLNWLHFPKCGSSLTNTLYHYGCRDVETARVFDDLNDSNLPAYKRSTCSYCYETCRGCFTLWAPHDGLIRTRNKKTMLRLPFREKHCAAKHLGFIPGHNPLPKDQRSERSGYIIAMFREPRKRLESAFNYRKHSFGMNSLDRERMLQVTHTLEAFANFPGIAGCQTKMLLGSTCGAHMLLTDIDVMVAKRIIRDSLALSGIMEHWNASICLFHRMYGGKMHPTELTNLRPTQEKTDSNFRQKNQARLEVLHSVQERVRSDVNEQEFPPSDVLSYQSRDIGIKDSNGRKLLFSEWEDDDQEFGQGQDFATTESEYSQVEQDELLHQISGRFDQLPKTEWKKLTREHDPWDWEIYSYAKQIFYTRLKEYGFRVPDDLE